jgi:formate C-acetyltransferase
MTSYRPAALARTNEKEKVDPGRSVMQRAAKVSKSEKDDGWRQFKPGSWCNTIDMRGFITSNVAPYTGDESFLKGPTRRTMAVWEKLQPYFQQERTKGVLAVDAQTPSTLLAHKPGYIDRANEVIVGLQTDQLCVPKI